MNNTDMYMNGLLNILNGESIKENPLFYFTKKFKNICTKNKFTLNYNSIKSNQLIDVDNNNNIYTFDLFDENIIIIKFSETKNPEILLTIETFNDNNNYCLKIIKDQLWYTCFENNKLNLNCVNLNSLKVLTSVEIGNINDNVILKTYYYKNNEYYLYVKNGTALYRIKANFENIQNNAVIQKVLTNLSPNFDYEVEDIYVTFVMNENRLTKYYTDTEISTLNVYGSNKKMHILDGVIYICGALVDGNIKLLKIGTNNLKQIRSLNVDGQFKHFKIKYNEIYIFDNYINKLSLNEDIILKENFTYEINDFVISNNLNLYVVSKNTILEIKQYTGN